MLCLSVKKIFFLFILWLVNFSLIFSLLGVLVFTFPPRKSQVLGTSIGLEVDSSEIYSAIPNLVPEQTLEVETEDGREILINKYLTSYKANPDLIKETSYIVQESDKKGVNPRLIVAIARKESSFCKNIASLPDGTSSNNCGGLGIYGNQILAFSSIHDWVTEEINFLADNYFSRGITDPCEIEKTYTPPAKGRWCQAINSYLDEMK